MPAQQLITILAQNGGDAGALGGLICMGVWVLLALVGFFVWVWALIDAIKNPALDSNMRLIWVLVILFANLLGALIYLVVGRSRATQSPE